MGLDIVLSRLLPAHAEKLIVGVCQYRGLDKAHAKCLSRFYRQTIDMVHFLVLPDNFPKFRWTQNLPVASLCGHIGERMM